MQNEVNNHQLRANRFIISDWLALRMALYAESKDFGGDFFPSYTERYRRVALSAVHTHQISRREVRI